MKDQPETRTCVLKLRLGACLTAPTKRLAADLHAASVLYNQARNAMIRHWERWCEDHLFEERTISIKGKKNPITGAAANPRTATVRVPMVPDKYQLPAGFATELYHAGRAIAPALAPNIVAGASNSLLSAVNKTMPYAPGRRARRVWQAVLGSEASRPVFRSTDLLVPNQNAKLSLTDSGYTFSFPVWSTEVDRKTRTHCCRLGTRRLAEGYKRILIRIASGEYKLCDSELIFHEGTRRKPGFWSIHLCYHRPQESLKLNPDRVAILRTLPADAENPFEIACPDAFPRDRLGDAHVLAHEYRRLDERRLRMRRRHRDKVSGRHGHGRQRIESVVRPVTRAVRNLMHRFSWRVVADVVRYCTDNDCGVVEYDEPSLHRRAASWFAERSVPYDWTGLRSRLEHRLWLCGITLRECGGDGPDAGSRSRAGSGDGGTSNGARAKKAGGKRSGKSKPLAGGVEKAGGASRKKANRRNGKR